MLETIAADALRQAADLLALDAPRAEAWASDLLALVDELGDEAAAERVAAELAAAATPAAAAALLALQAMDPAVTDGIDIAGPRPPWADDLGTSVCDGAWLLRGRVGTSAALRFVDRAEARHVLSVDLVPGPPEHVGEITVGPGDLLDTLEEADAEIELTEQSPIALTTRVIAALEATERPRPSAVMNGRLLVARLAPFADHSLTPPRSVVDVVPELPPRDPDDDAYAVDLLVRALGDIPSPESEAVADAASTLRDAAAVDAPLAEWLAASAGPVDLDAPDLDVVLAALAALVAPARLEPLGPDAREATLVLESADWLGAVLGLVRAGQGTDVEPMSLVDHVNRCPEITTTVPKADRERVAWAFAVLTEPWTDLGLAAHGCLTEFGVLALPRALVRAWSGEQLVP